MFNINAQVNYQIWLISLAIVAGVIILSVLICRALKLKRPTEAPKVVIDQTFMMKLISSLGGKDNIERASIIEGRIKFVLHNIELINSDGLKELSTTGVFITQNAVKMLFKYESATILDALELKNESRV